MPTTELTWEEISQQFKQEWVLLDNYDWPDEDEYPKRGIVTVHAPDRVEFDRLLALRDARFDSAIIFVGGPSITENSVTTRGYSRVEFGGT